MHNSGQTKFEKVLLWGGVLPTQRNMFLDFERKINFLHWGVFDMDCHPWPATFVARPLAENLMMVATKVEQ